MDTLVFLGVIVCLGLVLAWYLFNDLKDARGQKGLLAIRSEDETLQESRAYKLKEPDENSDSAAAFRTLKKRKGFQEKDDPGYRSKGPLPRYGRRSPRA